MDASQTTSFQAPGLSRKISLAWLALAWEGLWPRLVPVSTCSPDSTLGSIRAFWPLSRWP